jgi:3-hydroxyisobutyrate dehydrogenase-like beta-hydroxyacid dehydrogenase
LTISFGLAGSHSAALPFLKLLRAAGIAVRDVDARRTPGGKPDLAGVTTLLLVPRDIMESERLLFEEEAFARTLPELGTIILSGTSSPRYIRALRARIAARITLIDAPVAGTPAAVESGQGTVLVGGPAAALDRLTAVFDSLGRTTQRMGDFGTAMSAKVLQDCLSAASSAMARSALDWADAQGIEETRLLGLLEATFGQRMALTVADPAALVVNALPGDNAGVVLVRSVESALDAALSGVHLTPPRGLSREAPVARVRHLH